MGKSSAFSNRVYVLQKATFCDDARKYNVPCRDFLYCTRTRLITLAPGVTRESSTSNALPTELYHY